MSLEGYPLMEGGQYPSEGYGQGGYAGSSEYGGGVGPFEEFSTEDNQLLMSVLSSTPVPEQYNLAYPTSVPGSMQMWDGNHAYTPQMGSFGFFASPQTSPHLSHTMAGARGPPVMHPNMSGAMHGAMSSSQTHMAGNQPNTGFGTGTAPNPFAMRHEGQHHASMKQEGVVPVFTPNSAPYNTSATQHLPSAYSATLMAAPHGPLPVQRTSFHQSHVFGLFYRMSVRQVLDVLMLARSDKTWPLFVQSLVLPLGMYGRRSLAPHR